MVERDEAPGEGIVRSIRRTLRLLVAATVVLYLAVVGVAGVTLATATQLRESVCSLREDLEHRVQQSEQFLIDNPNGTPGIPRALIEDGIENQQRTIDALADVDCP